MKKEIKAVETLINEGKIAEANDDLLKILQNNPYNDEAWVCLASITEDRVARQNMLEKAIDCNPNNQIALKALQKMVPPGSIKQINAKKRKLSIFELLICGWPFLLVFFGGAIGGGLGGLAFGINAVIFRTRMNIVLKVILVVFVGGMAIIAWYYIAMEIVNRQLLPYR